MLFKKSYLIKFGRTKTIIKTDDQTIKFKLKNRDDFKTITAGRISDFVFFESQLKSELKKMGFNKWTFKKPVAYVTIPTNFHPSDIKMVFDSFDSIGFNEIQTIFTHHAMVYNINRGMSFKQKIGVIDIEDDRIEFSLIDGKDIVKDSSIDLGFERMNRYFSNPKFATILEEMILEETEHFFGTLMGEIKLVIAGNKKSAFGTSSKLLQKERIDLEDTDEAIIKGLESILKYEKFNKNEGKKRTKRNCP